MERIAWEEPLAFKRAWEKQQYPARYPWWQPVAALGSAVLGIGGMALHNRPIAGNWPVSIAVMLGVGLMTAYGLPFLTTLSPRLVTIYENGVGYNQVTGGGVRMVRWKWEQVRYCSLETMNADGREYTVLGVHFADNTWLPFALSAKVDPNAIEPYLASHGKDLYRRSAGGTG